MVRIYPAPEEIDGRIRFDLNRFIQINTKSDKNLSIHWISALCNELIITSVKI